MIRILLALVIMTMASPSFAHEGHHSPPVAAPAVKLSGPDADEQFQESNLPHQHTKLDLCGERKSRFRICATTDREDQTLTVTIFF